MKRITRWHRTNEATKLDATKKKTKKKKDLRACKWRRGGKASRKEREAAKMERIKRGRQEPSSKLSYFSWPMNMHEGRFRRLTVRGKIRIEQWRSKENKEKGEMEFGSLYSLMKTGNQRKIKGKQGDENGTQSLLFFV